MKEEQRRFGLTGRGTEPVGWGASLLGSIPNTCPHGQRTLFLNGPTSRFPPVGSQKRALTVLASGSEALSLVELGTLAHRTLPSSATSKWPGTGPPRSISTR